MTILTGEDARKFRAQVRYGMPKEAARRSVARGVEMAKELAETGCVRLTVQP